ncbi:unnamed protein product [Rangifer tarandus platyrhynchus]|uniref:Uncharacterized protein n=2 Tax=Rangifer tarandus platyrhynchus TaxID=3082113 RepID=A0ACB1MIV1_RANTA|nr:unnamed protein product [Rangifer tarandus platyrhynchus]
MKKGSKIIRLEKLTHWNLKHTWILQSRTPEWVAIPSPGDLPDAGIELKSPGLAGRFFATEPPWETSTRGSKWLHPGLRSHSRMFETKCWKELHEHTTEIVLQDLVTYSWSTANCWSLTGDVNTIVSGHVPEEHKPLCNGSESSSSFLDAFFTYALSVS